MNTEQEIENTLRHAPRPAPPAGLKERLVAQMRLPNGRAAAQPSVLARPAGGWLRRWWPALAPATVSLACTVVLTVQQMEIHDLKQALQALPQGPAAAETASPTAFETTPDAVAPADTATSGEQELARLKQLAGQLTAEVAQLEQLRAENQKLRAQLAARPAGLTREEEEAVAKARENALRIQCVNNLKQMGLSVRVWALDNADMSPPNVLCMSNELSTPKVLVCPADTARQPAADWASFTPANCSYEYLAPSTPDIGIEPMRVLFRCPIHGSVTLCDGSVQTGIAKSHPEWFIERNGKLYQKEPEPPPPDRANPTPNP